VSANDTPSFAKQLSRAPQIELEGETMETIVGDLWRQGKQLATRVTLLIKIDGGERLQGTLSATVGVQVGDVYQFRADDGRSGELQVFQIVPPDAAHFTFVEILA
jgi:hypothetical protein